MNMKGEYYNEQAVSVIIGTLLLIAVVAAAAFGIALMVSGASKDTAKQASVSQSVANTQVPVYVAGSDNMDVLTRSLATSYYEKNPGIRVMSSIILPDSVYTSMKSKIIDLGAIAGSRYNDDFVMSPDFKTKQVAESAVVVITNKINSGVTGPVQYADLKSFFSGLGASGNIKGTATWAIRSDVSGTTDTFYKFLSSSPPVGTIGSDADMISAIAATPQAIGYADYSDVQTAIDNNVGVSIVTIGDLSPSGGFYASYTPPTYDNLATVAKYKYLSTQLHADGTPMWAGTQVGVTGYNLSLIYPLYYVSPANPGAESGFLNYATSLTAVPDYKRVYTFPVASF